MTLVVWWTLDPDSIARGYWDQGVLEDLFADQLWPLPGATSFHHLTHPGQVPDGQGAIVVLPGRFHADKFHAVNHALAGLAWCLLIVSSDEERLFPLDELDHPNLRLWVQTPRHGDPGYGFGVGYPPGCRDVARPLHREGWFFSGQMTHARRREAGAVLQKMEGHETSFFATPGFTQGRPQAEYWEAMARATVAPCPGGPETPDSFRVWEALELGCVPLVDTTSTKQGETTYWTDTFGAVKFPLVDDWRIAPELVSTYEHHFPYKNMRASAWWTGRKRDMVWRLEHDLRMLERRAGRVADVDDLITVIVPTSAIPSHPSTEILDETLETVRVHLPRAEIIIGADHGGGAYMDYLWRVANRRDRGVLLAPADGTQRHQSGMMRDVLNLVRTPLVLFVEHDTPLTPDRWIDFQGCARAILSGEANVIRFHHEAHVLDVHQHLMVDQVPQDVCHVPLLRCAQWSQRPHLASAGYYRRIIAEHFDERPRFIEDVMHSVLDCAWRDEGYAGWDRHRLMMYAPPGDIKRSYHTDGRRHGG